MLIFTKFYVVMDNECFKSYTTWSKQQFVMYLTCVLRKISLVGY
jgi:hypothetical protein